MTETLMAEKTAKAFTFLPRQMKLWAPIAAFVESGGSEQELIAVYHLISLQHMTREADGIGHDIKDAFAKRKSDQARAIPGGGFLFPRSTAAAAGEGHLIAAEKSARNVVPSPPSADVLAAAQRAKTQSAKSVFERELTHTGRQWGNVSYRELDSMVEDGDVALALKKHIGSLRGEERHKTISDLLTPREFILLIKKVRKS